MSIRTRRFAWVAGAAAPVLALAVLVPAQATAAGGPPAKGGVSVTTADFLPGVAADLHLPDRPGKRRHIPLIVMVPGGGWQTADRTGFGLLAQEFAAKGVAVSNTTYRVGGDVRFPVPAQDASCAVDAAVATVRSHGLEPGPVVILGHSAGAHLSSLVAFGGDTFDSPDCPYPDAEIDGWVGISGIYDLRVVGPFAWPMMGVTQEEDPAAYDFASTDTHVTANAARKQHLDALVLNGTEDEFGITADYARGFADMLRDAGHQTRVEILEGFDHNEPWQQASTTAPLILRWLHQVED